MALHEQSSTLTSVKDMKNDSDEQDLLYVDDFDDSKVTPFP